jgi:hypothetical protein
MRRTHEDLARPTCGEHQHSAPDAAGVRAPLFGHMSLILAPDRVRSRRSVTARRPSVFWCALLTRTLSASDVDAGLGRKFFDMAFTGLCNELQSILAAWLG